ncbi:MAG: FHA domain-containing protein [Candidatus Brocadiae bacterium]|nr:FHA domain-containing protein [Candidatus Brocadiia bacterium]
MTSLTLKLGDDPQVIPLGPDPLTVGRSSQNGIAIMDSSLSRVHCELRRVNRSVTVRDLGSRNGTLVNGEPVKERELKAGDQVDVGICRIRLIVEPDGIKLEVAAGKPGEKRSDAPETKRLRAEGSETAENLGAAMKPSVAGDVVGWGRRSSGAGPAIAAGVAFLAVAGVVTGLVLRNRSKPKPVATTESWKSFDYPPGKDLSADWKGAPASPTALVAAPGREGGGMEVARKPGERGLAEAWGPRVPVEEKKAYRLTGWLRPSGGAAGLRVGWLRAGTETPFAWSGTGLTAEEGDVGGTWAVPEGAVEAQLACTVSGDMGRAVFDDIDFSEGALADRPPVAGRAVKAVFEAPGIFYFTTRDTSWIPAAVGLDGADATCAVRARRSAAGADYDLPNPEGVGVTSVTEERDAEGEGFVLRFAVKGAGARLVLGTSDTESDGRPVIDRVRTPRVVIGRGAGRIVLELRPEATVSVVDGKTVIAFPAEAFEIAFQPEGSAVRPQAGLEEASKAESSRQFGKALGLYETVASTHAKTELGLAAQERADVLRGVADAALRRARARRADAEFSGRLAGCDEAAQEYLTVEREFEGTEYAHQAMAEREAVEALRAQIAAEAAGGEVGRLLQLAEAYLNEGRLALARAFCEAVMDRTTHQDAAAKAEILLQRIDAQEKDR